MTFVPKRAGEYDQFRVRFLSEIVSVAVRSRILVGVLLVAAACADRQLEVTSVDSGAGFEVKLQFLGEYPSNIERIQLSEIDSGTTIWSVEADGIAQLWQIALRLGDNPVVPALSDGHVRVSIPSASDQFSLRPSVRYLIEVWDSPGRPRQAIIQF